MSANKTISAIRKMQSRLSPAKQDRIIRGVAQVVHKKAVKQTPRRWTGETKKAWKVRKIKDSYWEVFNESNSIWWLDQGTRAHGPVRAKRLFVPLTRRAFRAGPQGVLQAQIAAEAQGARSKFRMGKDYVLAKRVKGIKPIYISRNLKLQASILLRDAQTKYANYVTNAR